jgi:hypothetical protein
MQRTRVLDDLQHGTGVLITAVGGGESITLSNATTLIPNLQSLVRA